MKVMKLGDGLPIKVKDCDVDKCIKDGYIYCTKSEWKQKVRDADINKINDKKNSKK